MREKAEAKKQEKASRLAEERRRESEIAAHNPWGKGGCGAPLRNTEGEVVTDLKQVFSPACTLYYVAEQTLSLLPSLRLPGFT